MKKTAMPLSYAQLNGVVAAITFAVFFITAIRISFDSGYSYNAIGCHGYLEVSCYITFFIEKLAFIAAGLVFVALGLRLRKFLGSLVVLAACSVVVASYYLWYSGTIAIMKQAEFQDFSQLPGQKQRFLPLLDANFLDIAVLGFVLLIFVWQLTALWRSLRANSESSTTRGVTSTI